MLVWHDRILFVLAAGKPRYLSMNSRDRHAYAVVSAMPPNPTATMRPAGKLTKPVAHPPNSSRIRAFAPD
jgi:hypothetical protein